MKEKIEEKLGIQLHDSYTDWKALCPFHDERTPSFFISKNELVCHCFGCGIGGSLEVIVAKKTGSSVAKVRHDMGLGQYHLSVPREISKREKIFSESWLEPWPKIKNHPLTIARGFEDATMINFGARWDSHTKRIVFPLYRAAQLCGAIGRATDNRPPKWYKYWNCRTELIVPHYIDSLSSSSRLVITEGIFDMMYLAQHRYNAACILGSHASYEQGKILKNLCHTAVLALDNDEAGIAGTTHLEQLLKDSCSILHVVYPSGVKDVCELTKEQLRHMIDNPITPVEKHTSANNQ